MFDLLIHETGNGGDALLQGADLAVSTGYDNMLYEAMFGGPANPDDCWMNKLLLADGQDQQFTSQTETALKTNPLTSSGRINIENAIKQDLAFLKNNIPGTTVTVATQIIATDRLDIFIDINGQTFYYQYNPNTQLINYVV